MPTDSQYTEPIIKFMQEVGRPVTPSEIQEAVGMSRQGTYYWINNVGRTLVKPVGEGRNSATAYVLREDAAAYPSNFKPHGMWSIVPRKGRAKEEPPNLKLGARFTVIGVRLENDEKLIDMKDDTGVTLTINMGSDT